MLPMSWERPLLFIVHAGGTTGCLTRWNLQGRLLQLVHSRYKAKPPKSKLKKELCEKNEPFRDTLHGPIRGSQQLLA
jgi:hypothetical protein